MTDTQVRLAKPVDPENLYQPASGGGAEREKTILADEPTRLERIIASQFRRGLPVPLTPREQQDLGKMNLEQRCDFIAKVVVWTARAIERRIKETA